MRVILLAGGLGTRLQTESGARPKPMVEVGGTPILSHIMQIYARSGFKEFVVALGYRGDVIKDYFLNIASRSNDLTVDLGSDGLQIHGHNYGDWKIHLVDTGQNTQTGGRIAKLKDWVGDDTFMLTYGDGVADVDLHKLVDFHRENKKIATVTAVRPPARFGSLHFNGNTVTHFNEKPDSGEGWINGGFFVLEPDIFRYVGDETMPFERQPMEDLVRDGQLNAYKHEGFWQCVDTPRDLRLLEDLWESGNAQWLAR
jgi:glucose-1-phosphate cytidylyltransferase